MPALAKSGFSTPLTLCVIALHLAISFGARPAEHADVIVVAQRIVQRVALRKNSKIGSASLRAFLDAVALGHRARAHVAHDALDRDHLHRLHQRLALVQHPTKCVGTPAAASLPIT